MDKTTILTGSGKEFITAALNSQGKNITEEEVESIFGRIADDQGYIDKENLKEAFVYTFGALGSDEDTQIYEIIEPFLDYMDSIDGDDEHFLNTDTTFDLKEVTKSNYGMYEAIVKYESDGTVTSSNNNSSSNTSSSSASTNASLESLIPANPVSYKNLGDASVNYHSEVPGSLRWTGNSTNINVYSLKDGDSSEKFRKINPEDMRYFSKEYGKDIRVDGQKIIANETNEVIGYWNKNKDDTNSFYLKDGITYSSITSYLYSETTENDGNSGSAGDSGSTGDGTKSEDRTTFEGSAEWKDSNHKQCSGTARYFEKSGFTIDGDVVKKDGKIIGICDKIDDSRVNITIINDDSAEIKNLTSESNMVDGVEQGHYDYTESADKKTVTINICGADSKTCEIISNVTKDGFEIDSVEIGGEDLTEANFKELIESIKDPDTLDMLFDSGILNKVQKLKKGEKETKYFKEILTTLNTNGHYSDFADINSYEPNESEKTKYNELKDNTKEKSSDSLKEILEACKKGEISVTSALYLLNKVAPDLCSGGEDNVGSLEDVFRGMDTPDEEKYISTFLKLIAAANYRTKEDNTEVKSPESTGSTGGTGSAQQTSDAKQPKNTTPESQNQDSGTTGNDGQVDNSAATPTNNGEYVFEITDKDSFVNATGYSIDKKVVKDAEGNEIGSYEYEDGVYKIKLTNKNAFDEAVKGVDIKNYYSVEQNENGEKTYIIHDGDTTYTMTSETANGKSRIANIDKATKDGNTTTTNEDIGIESMADIIDKISDEDIKKGLIETYKTQYVLSRGKDDTVTYMYELSGNIFNSYSMSVDNGQDYYNFMSKTVLNIIELHDDKHLNYNYSTDKDNNGHTVAKDIIEGLYDKYDEENLTNSQIANVFAYLSEGSMQQLAEIINSFNPPEDKEKYFDFICKIFEEVNK